MEKRISEEGVIKNYGVCLVFRQTHDILIDPKYVFFLFRKNGGRFLVKSKGTPVITGVTLTYMIYEME